MGRGAAHLQGLRREGGEAVGTRRARRRTIHARSRGSGATGARRGAPSRARRAFAPALRGPCAAPSRRTPRRRGAHARLRPSTPVPVHRSRYTRPSTPVTRVPSSSSSAFERPRFAAVGSSYAPCTKARTPWKDGLVGTRSVKGVAWPTLCSGVTRAWRVSREPSAARAKCARRARRVSARPVRTARRGAPVRGTRCTTRAVPRRPRHRVRRSRSARPPRPRRCRAA